MHGSGARLRLRPRLLEAVVAVELGLLVLGELAAGSTCGASLTRAFVSATRSAPSSSVAPASGTNVCLAPNSPVCTSAHSGSPESASR